jgi:hypothetical protein
MRRKSIAIIAVAWMLSLVGFGAWVTAQEAPRTDIIYLGDQNVMVVVGGHLDANGALVGKLMVKRDGKFVPVVAEGAVSFARLSREQRVASPAFTAE